MRAIITDIARKIAINARITISDFFSSSLFLQSGFIRSSVSVELDVSTSDDSVDIDAERTRMTTIPISISGSDSSILGIIPSEPICVSSSSDTNILPKPPRK